MTLWQVTKSLLILDIFLADTDERQYVSILSLFTFLTLKMETTYSSSL